MSNTEESIRLRLFAEFQRRRNARDPAKRLTMTTLARRVGMARSQVHKKLHGDLRMTIEDANQIGAPLGWQFEVSTKRTAA